MRDQDTVIPSRPGQRPLCQPPETVRLAEATDSKGLPA